VADDQQKLLANLQQLESCVVAYSGGVDSAVVAKAAALALGERALAVTGVSASLAQGEQAAAAALAEQIGIRFVSLHTEEFSRPGYLQNGPDRCFHCKTELYSQLQQRLTDWKVRWIVNGANADDVGDYRPGMQAAAEHAVRSPLLECGFTKNDVRQLAAAWNLPVWDKPATPCLSSRVAYGLEVTPDRLARIDQAEQWLRQHGFGNCRVRYHPGDLARVEVPLEALPRLAAEELRREFTAFCLQLGFRFVTLDLAGFRSGSLNTLVVLE
jgi:uncharacterized protein